jgi:hypothetical protein
MRETASLASRAACPMRAAVTIDEILLSPRGLNDFLRSVRLVVDRVREGYISSRALTNSPRPYGGRAGDWRARRRPKLRARASNLSQFP